MLFQSIIHNQLLRYNSHLIQPIIFYNQGHVTWEAKGGLTHFSLYRPCHWGPGRRCGTSSHQGLGAPSWTSPEGLREQQSRRHTSCCPMCNSTLKPMLAEWIHSSSPQIYQNVCLFYVSVFSNRNCWNLSHGHQTMTSWGVDLFLGNKVTVKYMYLSLFLTQ